MTIRAEKKAKTRHALIDAALFLSAERGFSALSLRRWPARRRWLPLLIVIFAIWTISVWP
jgi:hypothetical protein